MSHSHQYQPQPAPETTLMPTPTHSHHQRAIKLTIRHPSHTLKHLFLALWRSFTKHVSFPCICVVCLILVL
ncbi:hypothetical protein M405DRAFT_209268 [Rhizopogon salebrosus TDB-379]|nr:hypothetical protein M405DRAFT_209268 [Rhizopogon salebrosus TDB-379]